MNQFDFRKISTQIFEMALWLKESPEDSYGIFIHGYERESIDFQPPWVVYFIKQHVETTKLWAP